MARSPLGGFEPACLVPVTGRDGRPSGLFVLGPRLSEEPYSGEDKRLLLSVAAQSAIALENIRLAEEIAGRMEAEKRVVREIGIARDVQARLLPQSVPRLRTLELAAHCIQARSVGGDYYDFLDLGPQQIGFVLADVAGKGIQAALLMANLQAHLRSQSGTSPQDPLRVLRNVNHMLWKSTDAGNFATLFLGIYSDASRRLTFVNCGHNPPIRLRRDGSIEMLAATATVLGAFEEWECSLGRTQLASGDLLVAYSDGITEASRGDEQYGEERLVQVVRDHAHGSAEAIAAAILASVQEFGAGEQSDDLTLLVARALEKPDAAAGS
jgi:serine phosphatase RsbU (regulator of sigma subunit)